MPRLPLTRAMSLLEALAVVTILGIVLFLTLPHLTQSKAANERSAAKAKAAALSSAKDAYLSALGIDQAQNGWNAQGIGAGNNDANDNARFLLIRPYLPAPLPTASRLNPNLGAPTDPYYSVPGFLLYFSDPRLATPTAAPLVTTPVMLFEDNNLNGSYDANDTAIAY